MGSSSRDLRARRVPKGRLSCLPSLQERLFFMGRLSKSEDLVVSDKTLVFIGVIYMKSMIALLAVLAGAQSSVAAIKCTGTKVDAGTNVFVEIDGNPLKIYFKEENAGNAGLSLLVNVLESTNIMAETDSYSSVDFHADFQIKPAGLPRGSNAKLIVRQITNSALAVKKDVYVLKCSGMLPAVYRNQ